MNKRISLDTNLILRYLLCDVPEQTNLVQELVDSDVLIEISDLAIAEAVSVLSRHYELPRDKVSANLELIYRDPRFNCNTNLFEVAMPLYVSHPRLSFIDCCLVVQAELNEAVPLMTFDKKLATQTPRAKLLK